MKIRFITTMLVVYLVICAAGCLSPAQASPPLSEPLPAATPSPESTRATVQPGGMALQVTDLSSDYLLKDRTVVAFNEVSQLARDLGWQQGYRVTFYRMNREKEDMTGIIQSISVYPPENIYKVFAVEKEAMITSGNSDMRYEIPFPATGDQSIAFRESRPGYPLDFAVYTVIFTKKNVFETITMGGTTTDYETLKDVVRKAADRIR
jgi:hypothetical protein